MKDKELRKLIGSRAKQRRLELNLTQPYVAEKMGVTASTILRYENGSIDNTKKMVLEGLSEALHVSIEWLKGETDEYETDITDKKELQIRDAMGDILKQFPLDLNKTEDAFSKDLLLLMLKQYELFLVTAFTFPLSLKSLPSLASIKSSSISVLIRTFLPTFNTGSFFHSTNFRRVFLPIPV
jgi:transcriptional regulator with XRE-family HTH domain